MKLAISNIAWPPREEPAVMERLGELGMTGVEIAPTLVWPEPLSATDAELLRYRRRWEEKGIAIVAMQSLLFGHPELTLFDDQPTRQRTLAHLAGMVRVGSALGAGVLVFGSPQNRRAGSLPRADRDRIARDFFASIGETAGAAGLIFAIEPNPPRYGCDYVTTMAEGAVLVGEVGHPGFRLHLDAGALSLEATAPFDAPPAGLGALLAHFHVSEVDLAPIGSDAVPHAEYARALRAVGYSRWVSIEMRSAAGNGEDAAARVTRAIASARASYLGTPPVDQRSGGR